MPAKHRGTLYAVVRTQQDGLAVVVGVYLTPDRADEIKARYVQEMKDRGFGGMFQFSVNATTYYDE